MNAEKRFLQAQSFAVAGASNDREKYGNRVYRELREFVAGGSPRSVYPINPKQDRIEGDVAYPSIGELPVVPEALSIITPPPVTAEIVRQAIKAGVKQIWIQPGAEDADAVKAAEEAGVEVISDGPCILVAMRLG